MKLSGAQIMCESLLREGVDVLFGHPGGAILPFYDALYGYQNDLRHILVRHEQAAAHAAVGYARAANTVGVCVATSGPGATNLITGLADAKMDSVPLVAITGQVTRAMMGREGFQECDTTSITKPVVKRNYLVLRASDLTTIFQEAFAVARSGRPGPVLIDVPRDIQLQMTTFNPRSISETVNEGTFSETSELIKEAAHLINNAKRPVIIAGHGVFLAKAWEQVRTLAEKANIPVVNTLHGIGVLPADHHLCLGMLGMHGMYSCNIATNEADLVLGIGMRFDDRIVGKPGTFAPQAKVIHIEIEFSQVGKGVTTHLPLIGDAREVLNALIPSVENIDRSPWLQRIRQVDENHPSTEVPDSPGLLPQYVLAKLNETAGKSKDAVVVTGVGQHQMWAAQFLKMGTPHSFISSGGLGVMGYELPAALGAQVARPEATVWSLAGDGGFQMTTQELATVVNEELPIKIALINNGHLGMVRQWQKLFFGERYQSVPIPGPDYVKLAQAYGMPGIRVTNKEDVEEAIEKALHHPGPFLIEFVVEPEEDVYPMVPPGGTLGQTLEDPRISKRVQASTHSS